MKYAANSDNPAYNTFIDVLIFFLDPLAKAWNLQIKSL